MAQTQDLCRVLHQWDDTEQGLLELADGMMVDTSHRQKIIYLMIAADAVGGTEIAVRRQALALEAYYDVEIVSLFRITPKVGTGRTNPKVRYLMNEDGGRQRYGALFQDI